MILTNLLGNNNNISQRVYVLLKKIADLLDILILLPNF